MARFAARDKHIVEGIITTLRALADRNGVPFHLFDHYDEIIRQHQQAMSSEPHRQDVCTLDNIDDVYRDHLAGCVKAKKPRKSRTSRPALTPTAGDEGEAEVMQQWNSDASRLAQHQSLCFDAVAPAKRPRQRTIKRQPAYRRRKPDDTIAVFTWI